MKNTINQFIVVFVLGILLTISGCRLDEDKKGEKKIGNDHRDKSQLLLMDAIHQKKLREIQYYFIQTGVADFYKTRDFEPIKEYVVSRGYSFWVGPAIDKYHTHEGKTYHTWVRLVIQSKNMLNELYCMEQLEHDSNIYEYWVIQEDSKGRNYTYRNCEFLITKAKSQQDERTIIHSSDQFFSEYRVAPDFVIKFPKDILFKLNVGSYPESFKDTDMKEVKDIFSKLK